MGELMDPAGSQPLSKLVSAPTGKPQNGLDNMDKIILDWLVRSGFERTFLQMPTAKVFSDNNTVTLTDRAKLMNFIKAGQMGDAIVFIRATFPLLTMIQGDVSSAHSANCSLIDAFKHGTPLPVFYCYFILLLQQLIELIRSKDLVRALEWIEVELVQVSAASLVLKSWLGDALGLLAYADPVQSPLSELLDQARWTALAEHLNQAICIKSSSTSAPLELILKQIVALDSLVHECNVFGNDEAGAKQWSLFNRLLAGTNCHSSSGQEKLIKQD